MTTVRNSTKGRHYAMDADPYAYSAYMQAAYHPTYYGGWGDYSHLLVSNAHGTKYIIRHT